MKNKYQASQAMKRPGPAGETDAPADFPPLDLRDFFSASEARADR